MNNNVLLSRVWVLGIVYLVIIKKSRTSQEQIEVCINLASCVPSLKCETTGHLTSAKSLLKSAYDSEVVLKTWSMEKWHCCCDCLLKMKYEWGQYYQVWHQLCYSHSTVVAIHTQSSYDVKQTAPDDMSKYTSTPMLLLLHTCPMLHVLTL